MNKAFRDLVEQTQKENQMLREQLREIQPRFEAEIRRRQDIINGLTRDRDELLRRLRTPPKPVRPPPPKIPPLISPAVKVGAGVSDLQALTYSLQEIQKKISELSDMNKTAEGNRKINDKILREMASKGIFP